MLRKIKAQLIDIFYDKAISAAVVAVNEEMFDSLCSGSWQLDIGDNARVYLVPDRTIEKNSFKVTPKTDKILTLPSNAYLLV